jgi:hypothetical protein
MPTNKDFKRLVRTRMGKTGEAYTTARARLLQKKQRPTAATARNPEPASAPDYARLAGMSDVTIKAKTGCTWERWVDALDHVGAQAWPHREIARYVHEKYQVPGWWTQWVTTGYERIKGLRDIGQRRGGGYEANKSKVIAVPLGRLYRAFRDTRVRRRWLGTATFTVRTATPEKSIRVTWSDGTPVQLFFESKGAAKSQIVVQHGGLPDKAAAERMKAYWGERLTALHEQLTRRAGAR